VTELPRVAFVVLSWNGREDTLACLDSLAEATYPSRFVVVVDNGSEDGSADAVAAAHPDAVLVRLDRNHGFTGGVNRGIMAALEHGADAVVLLNNDMVVEAGFVEPLVRAVAEDPSAAAACCQILFADQPDRIWYAGAAFRPGRGHHGRNTHFGAAPLPASTGPYATECACAGAMLIPRASLEQIGLLEDDLFAYREDLEWSLRARSRGRRVLVVPASVVRHKVSASTGGEASPTSLYYDVRNGIVVAERYDPRGRLRTASRRGESVLAHLAQGALSRRRFGAVRAVVAGWWDGRQGKLGQRTR
jgi:GT2 family glycosyltransferase